MNLLEYFEGKQSEIIDLTRALCKIESPSGDARGSRAVVDLLAAHAAKLRCVDAVEKIIIENLGEHLIVRAFSELNEKPVLLLGHTDTVHPLGSLAINKFRVEGDKVFAPGVFDMKSGCAMMFAALRALEELSLKPKRPVTILLSCDEETGSETGRKIVEREASKAAFCLVLEPSANGRLKTGRKGTANYVLKAHGVAAHAGLEPEKGASAILEIAGQIKLVQALSKAEIGTTVNVCTVAGGTATNVIPEFAECSVDVRFAAMEEAERIDREIKKLQSVDARVSLTVAGGINRPPLERTAQVSSLYATAQHIAESFHYNLGETQVGGASDGNFVAALGVPTLDGLGAAGDGAHTNHEYIRLSDIAPRAALLAALITAL